MFHSYIAASTAYTFYLLVDAVISFPSGLTITWEGKPIGRVAMSDLAVTGDVGGSIDNDATFTVLDVDHLTAFTEVRPLPLALIDSN